MGQSVGVGFLLINVWIPKRHRFSVLDTISELNNRSGCKCGAGSALALVFHWLHAFVFSVIELREIVYVNTLFRHA